MFKGCLGFLVFLFQLQFAFGFAREQLNFTIGSGRRLKNLYLVKNSIVEVTGEKGRKIASITSNSMRSEVELHFPRLVPHMAMLEDLQQININRALSKLATIRTFPLIFDDVGFPQLGMVIRWQGSIYALIYLSVEDLRPEQVASIDSPDAEANPQLDLIRMREGVSGAYGNAFGGAEPSFPVDSAALVSLDEPIPMILKVYDLPATLKDSEIPGLKSDIYKIVADLAYFELKTKVSDFEVCEAKL